MREETRIALKMFVEKADFLVSSRFAQFMREQDSANLNYKFKRGEPGQVTYPRPDYEATVAFAATLRLFFHKDEHISFRWLANHVLDDPGLSNHWKQEFQEVRTDVQTFLASNTSIAERVVEPVKDDSGQAIRYEVVSESVLTYDDLRDIFINGELSHTEPRKKLVYERWKNNPLGFPLMLFEFDTMLGRLFYAINYVAGLCEQELSKLSTEIPRTP